jgi:inorganic pyrophosphatase
MLAADTYWRGLEALLAAHPLRLDRPRGSAHPRYPALIYPLDYGYLEGTRAADGGGIDVWVGTLPKPMLTGVICTVDMEKRDVEVKLLLGCTLEEARELRAFHTGGQQAALLVLRNPDGE